MTNAARVVRKGLFSASTWHAVSPPSSYKSDGRPAAARLSKSHYDNTGLCDQGGRPG
ncbi:MAG TPA: hypothetical protein PLN86_11930 [Candidatus Hydrogenedentes bacterium]|nr:hypothetical protein [Candidatus Hydrogenedentota bacterium]